MYDITLYSTECPQCIVLKKKMDARGLAYKENNDIQTMQDMGITYVPVLQVNETLMDFAAACRWVDAEEAE